MTKLNPKLDQIKVETAQISDAEYWQKKSEGPALKPLRKACGDCAIKTGFYQEFADLLSQQPRNVQEDVAARWFCHNKCNRACAGIKSYLNL